MATDIGPEVKIKGEKQYYEQMTKIGSSLKTLRSEMKVVTSEFAGNEKSTEALTAKNAVLEKETQKLNQQLAAQEGYLKKVAAAYGEDNVKTQIAQQAVNNTRAALNKVNAELRQNNDQIAKNSSALGKMGIDLDAIGSKLGLSSTAMGKLTSSFQGGVAGAAALSAALVKLAGDLVKLSNAAGQQADAVNTLARNYGLAVQDVQKFNYMAELTDVSTQTIAGSISKLVRNMNSARDGTGAAADAFQRLHVSVTDAGGNLRDKNAVFMETIDALKQIANETERDALAMDVFGKSAMELNGVIQQGSDGLQELADEAANSGYVMSDKMISVLQEGDDATQRFDKAMDGLKNTIGAGATPVVAGWKIILAEAADGMSTFIQQLAGMRDGADDVAKAVDGATESVRSWRDITAEDLVSDDWKNYKKYVNTMADWYRSQGMSNGSVENFDLWKENEQRQANGQRVLYDGSQNAHITLELNGYTVGNVVGPLVNERNALRGNGF